MSLHIACGDKELKQLTLVSWTGQLSSTVALRPDLYEFHPELTYI